MPGGGGGGSTPTSVALHLALIILTTLMSGEIFDEKTVPKICVPASLAATSTLTQNKGPGTEAHFWNPPSPGSPPPSPKQFSGRPERVHTGACLLVRLHPLGNARGALLELGPDRHGRNHQVPQEHGQLQQQHDHEDGVAPRRDVVLPLFYTQTEEVCQSLNRVQERALGGAIVWGLGQWPCWM